jgi:alcohol dehydrogenase (cytochrome c)
VAAAVVGVASATNSTNNRLTAADLAAAPNFTAKTLVTGTGANWQSVGGDLGTTRYSKLTQVNKKNVKTLKLAWKQTFNGVIKNENEDTPLVYNGVMYVPLPDGDVVAADAATGTTVWQWKTNVPAKGFVTMHRGLALGGGHVYTMNDAGTLVALSASTGAIDWQAQVALPGTSLEGPGAPIYLNGVVYTGMSGAERGRGHFDAYNATTGQLIWRTFTVLGSDDPKTGGGSIWTWASIDPKLGLAYATTGNDADTSPGNHPWTASVVAFDLKTGKIKWGFQGVHHDVWDYDCPAPPVLWDHVIKGKMRHGLEFVCKTDLHFELDRATGKPILPVKEVKTPAEPGGKTADPASVTSFNASPTQPMPQQKGEVTPHCATPELKPGPASDGSQYTYGCTYSLPGSDHFTAYAPGALGGQTWQSMSYNPQLGYVYFCQLVSTSAQQAGKVNIGAGLFQTTGWSGSVAAFDIRDNHMVWRNKWVAEKDGMCLSGSATTAGGLVFVGSNKGKTLYAYDAKTGKQLWSYTGDEYIAAPPIVYSVKGKEYIAVYTGGQIPLLGGPAGDRHDTMLVFTL